MGGNSGSRASTEPVPVSALSGFDPGREADLSLALDYALAILIKYEPPDSRAISDEFVAMAAISCDLTNDDSRRILREAIARECINEEATQ